MNDALSAARLLAHEHAMRTDPDYRSLMRRVTTERLETQSKKRRRQSTRRMWSTDNLPMARAFMRGPKWRRHFDVREVPIADIDPVSARYHRPGRKLLIFTFEDDVRELVQRGGVGQREEIRPGVFAEWSDPRERLADNHKEAKTS